MVVKQKEHKFNISQIDEIGKFKTSKISKESMTVINDDSSTSKIQSDLFQHKQILAGDINIKISPQNSYDKFDLLKTAPLDSYNVQFQNNFN
jgi:hypothetical protein